MPTAADWYNPLLRSVLYPVLLGRPFPIQVEVSYNDHTCKLMSGPSIKVELPVVTSYHGAMNSTNHTSVLCKTFFSKLLSLNLVTGDLDATACNTTVIATNVMLATATIWNCGDRRARALVHQLNRQHFGSTLHSGVTGGN